MKCPNCDYRIGRFSRLANSLRRVKNCPRCKKPFKFTVPFGKAFMIGFPLALIAEFAIGGTFGTALAGLSVGVAIFLSIKPVAV